MKIRHWQLLMAVVILLATPGCLTVKEVLPSNGAQAVDRSIEQIIMTFDKTLDPTSVNSNTFFLTDAKGGKVAGSVAVQDMSIVFTPASKLAPSTQFTVSAKMGIRGYYWYDVLIIDYNSIFQSEGRCWGTAQKIADDNSFWHGPEGAVGPDGDAIVVWSHIFNKDESDWQYDVYASNWDGTSWGTAQMLNPDHYYGPYRCSPHIAFGPVDKAIAVWEKFDSINTNYWNGALWEYEGYCGQFDPDYWDERIVYNPDGTALLVWYLHWPWDDIIYSRKWNGTSWETVQSFTTTQELWTCPEIAIGPNGTVMAVWGGSGGVSANLWDGISWGTSQTLSEGYPETCQAHIAFGSNGTAIAVWAQTDGQNWNIYAKKWNGTSWETTNLLRTDSGYAYYVYPGIAVGPDGSAIAVWTQDNTIYADFWNGTAWETAQPISESSGSVGIPQIVFCPDGTAIAVWDQSNGQDSDIFAKSWNGSSWGTAKKLQTGSSTTGAPQISVGTDGTVVVVWHQHDAYNSSIYANIYN